MARSEMERLYKLGMIGPWEYKNKLRGKPDTRDYLSGGGRGDDESMNGPDGHIHVIDAIDQREFQRPKPGFVADPKQRSANFPTGQGHIDERKPASGSWERWRKPDAGGRWSERLSVARAKRGAADEYWSNDWFGDQSGNKRQER